MRMKLLHRNYIIPWYIKFLRCQISHSKRKRWQAGARFPIWSNCNTSARHFLWSPKDSHILVIIQTANYQRSFFVWYTLYLFFAIAKHSRCWKLWMERVEHCHTRLLKKHSESNSLSCFYKNERVGFLVKASP